MQWQLMGLEWMDIPNLAFSVFNVAIQLKSASSTYLTYLISKIWPLKLFSSCWKIIYMMWAFTLESWETYIWENDAKIRLLKHTSKTKNRETNRKYEACYWYNGRNKKREWLYAEISDKSNIQYIQSQVIWWWSHIYFTSRYLFGFWDDCNFKS